MEPSISVTNDDLRGEIGAYLGYGRGAALSESAWDTLQTNDINVLMKATYNRVLEPVLPDGSTYAWSWLKPFASVTIDSGVSTARLPADFQDFEGPLYITDDSAWHSRAVNVSNIADIEQLHATRPTTTGHPQLAAAEPVKGTTPTGGSRWNLRVWPTTDGEYTLRVQYLYAPDVLSGGFPYPPGGALAGELFMAAAAAMAELKKDDIKGGPREQYFMERLVAAVNTDRKRKGNVLGRNGDPGMRRRPTHRFGWGTRLLINGVQYDNGPE